MADFPNRSSPRSAKLTKRGQARLDRIPCRCSAVRTSPSVYSSFVGPPALGPERDPALLPPSGRDRCVQAAERRWHERGTSTERPSANHCDDTGSFPEWLDEACGMDSQAAALRAPCQCVAMPVGCRTPTARRGEKTEISERMSRLGPLFGQKIWFPPWFHRSRSGSNEPQIPNDLLARPARFERATSGFEVRCSIQLS